VKVHRQNGLWVANGGYEYNLMIIAALFALADVGPGDLSLDEALGVEMKGARWALLQLLLAAGGSAAAIAMGESAKVGGEPSATMEGQGPAGDPATA
jgi:putative oxidoreductase